MKELPKVYDPKQVEKKIYEMWMEGGYFHAERDPEKAPFTIVIPPSERNRTAPFGPCLRRDDPGCAHPL
jgi:hypothetical protein